MIRFHTMTYGIETVSTRRRPRGYVVAACEVKKVVEVKSHFEASLNFVRVEGWVPVGFNGHTGEIHETMRDAADRLVSDSRFWEDNENHLGLFKALQIRDQSISNRMGW